MEVRTFYDTANYILLIPYFMWYRLHSNLGEYIYADPCSGYEPPPAL
jgi:hypothetical protein